MYCEECFDDMEKNGFAIALVTRQKKHRTRMVCPMCTDDWVSDGVAIGVFSSSSSMDEYSQKARAMRQSEGSGLGYKGK
jgi:hypothetical protein